MSAAGIKSSSSGSTSNDSSDSGNSGDSGNGSNQGGSDDTENDNSNSETPKRPVTLSDIAKAQQDGVPRAELEALKNQWRCQYGYTSFCGR